MVNKDLRDCLLLSAVMLVMAVLQLYWNGSSYIQGFNGLPSIVQALWQLGGKIF